MRTTAQKTHTHADDKHTSGTVNNLILTLLRTHERCQKYDN